MAKQLRYRELGNFLKHHREKMELTQAQLANTLGYTYQYVANWERGACPPPVAALYRISVQCKIDRSELMKAYSRERNRDLVKALRIDA